MKNVSDRIIKFSVVLCDYLRFRYISLDFKAIYTVIKASFEYTLFSELILAAYCPTHLKILLLSKLKSFFFHLLDYDSSALRYFH